MTFKTKSPELIERIRTLAAAGTYSHIIAEQVGVDAPRIRKLCSYYGIKLPRRGRPKGAGDKPYYSPGGLERVREGALYASKLRQQQVEARQRAMLPTIVEMRERQCTVEEIANACNVSHGTMRKIIARFKSEIPAAKRWRPEPKPKPEKRGMAWLNTAGLPKHVRKEHSLYVDAATFLAPHYRPVVRADIVDDPYSAPKGEPREYIVGTMRVPAVEMLDIARGLGFPA